MLPLFCVAPNNLWQFCYYILHYLLKYLYIFACNIRDCRERNFHCFSRVLFREFLYFFFLRNKRKKRGFKWIEIYEVLLMVLKSIWNWLIYRRTSNSTKTGVIFKIWRFNLFSYFDSQPIFVTEIVGVFSVNRPSRHNPRPPPPQAFSNVPQRVNFNVKLSS